MILTLRLLSMVVTSLFFLFLLVSLPASAEKLAYNAWIEATDRDQTLILASYCTAPSGSYLEYVLTAEKLSRSGKTVTTQRGHVVARDMEPVLLSRLSFEKNEKTGYRVELRLLNDGRFVAEDHYPQR